MNTLVIVLIAMVVLALAYVFYGRRIANKWGIDPNAETPAVKYNDGKDYVPTNGWTVFSHQFSSIAGAGPVTGAIQAAVFGWVPVLLWILIGGVFFGAVTDFGALYASVKNKGKSMGMLIEQYIGKLGRKLFTIFCWLFSLHGINYVYGICRYLRFASKEIQYFRLERVCSRRCIYRCIVCNRHCLPDYTRQGRLELCCICIYLCCRNYADLAYETAA